MPLVVVVVVLVVLVGIVLGVRAMIRAGAKLEAESRARIAAARPAQATVRSIASAAMQRSRGYGSMKSVIVTLAVDGADAEANGFWTLDSARISEVAVGAQVPVKIDAADPTLAYPALPGVEHDIGNFQIWTQERKRTTGQK